MEKNLIVTKQKELMSCKEHIPWGSIKKDDVYMLPPIPPIKRMKVTITKVTKTAITFDGDDGKSYTFKNGSIIHRFITKKKSY